MTANVGIIHGNQLRNFLSQLSKRREGKNKIEETSSGMLQASYKYKSKYFKF